MLTCPNNHESDAADFCSVCGIEMAASGQPGASINGAAECPTCHALRSPPTAEFCEVCGYSYKTGLCGIPFLEPEPVIASEPKPADPEPALNPSSPPQESAATGGQETQPEIPPVAEISGALSSKNRSRREP